MEIVIMEMDVMAVSEQVTMWIILSISNEQ